jgi:hypothetical protein
MVYQLSEKNQILVALFAIVLLCAGKLFKDYLFRRGYIEGMTGMKVTTETSTQLRRNASGVGAANVVAELYLLVTLERDLTPPQNIQLTWTGAVAADVTTSTTDYDYTASVVSGTTSATFPPPSGNIVVSTITFTPSATIKAGSKIRITVKNVTIYPGAKADSKLTFTVTPSNGETAVSRVFKILPAESATTQYSSPYQGTTAEIQAAITDINTRLSATPLTDAVRTDLLKARSALVTLLASTYGTVKEAGQVFDSDALYEAQRTAIQFIKTEKERAATNANSLKEDNSNKRRMAQINTYYTKNYEANTEVMKNIIFVSVALIVLAVLRNKDLIPTSISTLGVIFVLTLGGIVVGKQVFDIIRRNDHDFDKYDWSFNEEEMNDKQLLQQNSGTSNLSDMGIGMAPCYGPGCCDVGTSWSDAAKKCIPSDSRIDGTAAWSSSSGTDTLTISLKVTNALVTGDTITVALPSGVFSGTPAITGNAFTGPPSTTAPFPLTVAPGGASDSTTKAVPNIVITGLSIIPSDYPRPTQLKVKSSKDINEVGINITGIPQPS